MLWDPREAWQTNLLRWHDAKIERSGRRSFAGIFRFEISDQIDRIICAFYGCGIPFA
jgi:hypothetical protein